MIMAAVGAIILGAGVATLEVGVQAAEEEVVAVVAAAVTAGVATSG